MTEVLPFSSAAERNAEPIAKKLTELLPEEPARILEIGSGTGQRRLFCGEISRWTFSPAIGTTNILTQYVRISNWRMSRAHWSSIC